MIKKSVYIERAPAKVNLFLEIRDKRKDGYHNIETLYQAIGLCDVITFEILLRCGDAEDIDFEIEIDSNDEEIKELTVDNLVVKAIEVYFSKLSDKIVSKIDKVSFYIYINKQIPMQAGLAGGSANAAACLRALNRFFFENFNFAFSNKELLGLALELGSDVPFCLNCLDTPRAYAESQGEKFMDPFESHNKEYLDFNYDQFPQILVAKPNFGVSTKEAYELFDKHQVTYAKEKPKIGFFNRFEESIFIKYPRLAKIKQELLDSGCDHALMAGSGSSIIGFVNKNKDIIEIYEQVNEKLEDCDCFLENTGE